MFVKLLYALTELLLKLLKDSGVDTKKLIQKNAAEVELELVENELLKHQNQLSIKRAEIINNQRDLLAMVEPTLFSTLNDGEDNWQKTTITKLWFDKLDVINKLIDEHQEISKHFENTYIKIEKLREKLL